MRRTHRNLLLSAAVGALVLAGCADNRTDDPARAPASTDADAVGVGDGDADAASGESLAAGGRRLDPQPGSTAQRLSGEAVVGSPTAGGNPVGVATEGAPGPYLVNAAGSALYHVEGDTDGSKCTGECTGAWPPFIVDDIAPTAGDGLKAGLLGSIERPEGTTQVTYDGKPLYRYAADSGVGTTAGNGVTDQWGQWRLVGPDGEPVAMEGASAGE